MTIDSNRITSSKKSDYVEGERTKGAIWTATAESYEQREGRLYAEGERDG